MVFTMKGHLNDLAEWRSCASGLKLGLVLKMLCYLIPECSHREVQMSSGYFVRGGGAGAHKYKPIMNKEQFNSIQYWGPLV